MFLTAKINSNFAYNMPENVAGFKEPGPGFAAEVHLSALLADSNSVSVEEETV